MRRGRRRERRWRGNRRISRCDDSPRENQSRYVTELIFLLTATADKSAPTVLHAVRRPKTIKTTVV